MNLFIKSLFLIVLTSFILTSCCNWKYNKNDFEFSKTELSYLDMYEQHDTIYFKSNLGDIDTIKIIEIINEKFEGSKCAISAEPYNIKMIKIKNLDIDKWLGSSQIENRNRTIEYQSLITIGKSPLEKTLGYSVTFRNFTSGRDPIFTEIKDYKISNKAISNCYKIEHGYPERVINPSDIEFLYWTKKYGLTAYSNKNGEVWFIAKKNGSKIEQIRFQENFLARMQSYKEVMTVTLQSCTFNPPGSRLSKLQVAGACLSSGEIKESDRDLIRIHGGRQEKYDKKTKTWKEVDNPELKKTHGCLRAFDSDMILLKQKTDELEANDKEEKAGDLTITDDLVKKKNKYYAPTDLKKEDKGADSKYEVFTTGSGSKVSVPRSLTNLFRVFGKVTKMTKGITNAITSPVRKGKNILDDAGITDSEDSNETNDEVYDSNEDPDKDK